MSTLNFLSPSHLLPQLVRYTLLTLVALIDLSFTLVSAQPMSPPPHTPPHTPITEAQAARALAVHLDLERLITYQEKLDWVSDHSALNKLEERLLELTCQVSVEELNALHTTLSQEVERAGGPLEAQWRKASEEEREVLRDELSERLHLERLPLTLSYALSKRARCPFWLSPTPAFRGVHRDAGRLQLSLETMGGLQALKTNKGWAYGGSGQGRAFALWGLNLRLALGLGLEVGGASTFPRSKLGRVLSGMVTAGVPLIARWWLGDWRLDSEVALLARAPQDEDTLYGYRVAQGVGFSTLRISGFLPHVILWAGYERYYGPSAPRLADHVVRVGTRIGVSWGD